MCTSSLFRSNMVYESSCDAEPTFTDGAAACTSAVGFDGGEIGGEGGVAEVEIAGGGDGVAEAL